MAHKHHPCRARWSLAIIAATVALCAVSAGRNWDKGADQRLADYIFMEAQRQSALDNASNYFLLLNRAFALDTTQSSVGADLGYLYMMVADNDSATFETGYRMMGRHFQLHPDDYYGSMFYGTVSDRIYNSDEALKVWTTLDSIFPNKIDVTIRLADALSAINDSASRAKAITTYRRVETAEGKSPAISSRLIRAFFAQGDTTAITNEIHALINSAPGEIENKMFAAEIYDAIGKSDSALHYLNIAYQADSTNGFVNYKLANHYRLVGDSAAFDREVARAISSQSLPVSDKVEMLKSYTRQLYTDSLQRARINQLYSTLLDLHPHDIDVHDLYSAYLVAIDNYPAAAEQVRQAIDLDPSEDRWNSLMSLYFMADDYPAAIAQSANALRYHPNSPKIRFVRGNAFAMNEQNDSALACYTKAYQLADSTDKQLKSSILTSTADVYHKLGDNQQAYAYYEQALDLDPANTLAMNNYAYFLACEGTNLDRAEQLSAISVRNNPQNSTNLDTYAWVFFKKNELTMAKLYIDQALQFDNEPSAELLDHAGDIYFAAGYPDEAKEFWQKALELEPDNKQIIDKLEKSLPDML